MVENSVRKVGIYANKCYLCQWSFVFFFDKFGIGGNNTMSK